MAIKIMPRRKRKKQLITKKTPEAQAVLDKLQGFLEKALDEPVKILVNMWKDQALAVTFKELRSVVMDPDGDGEELISQWKQDYSSMLAEKMTPSWKDAFLTGLGDEVLLNGVEYSAKKELNSWILNRSTELAGSLTSSQHEALKYVLEESVSIRMSVDETARYIRPIVGLNQRQAAANLKHYDHVKATLERNHPRMKPENIERKARESAARYAEKQLRYRATTIAQSELVTAYHESSDIIMRRLNEEGLMPAYAEIWSTALVDVCEECAALEAVIVAIVNNGERKVYVDLTPQLHPRCKCALLREELTTVNTGTKAQEYRDGSGDKKIQALVERERRRHEKI